MSLPELISFADCNSRHQAIDGAKTMGSDEAAETALEQVRRRLTALVPACETSIAHVFRTALWRADAERERSGAAARAARAELRAAVEEFLAFHRAASQGGQHA